MAVASFCLSLSFFSAHSSFAKEPKCDKNFYGFDKSSSSKKCAELNLSNIKWPIGSTAVCKDGSFSFSKNKKSMCLKGQGVAKLRSK